MSAASICCFVLAIAACQGSPPAPAELQGTWKLTGIESNGMAREVLGLAPWVIKDNNVTYAGEPLARLSADVAATPKIIDLSFENPKRVYEGIYVIESDRLKICLNVRSEGIKERPAQFSTKNTENLRLLVFERDRSNKPLARDTLTGFVGVQIRFDKETKQILISDTLPNSPARKAGLKKDDLVLQIAGQKVTQLRPAVDLVRRCRPGSDVVFQVRRDGKERNITIPVGIVPFELVAELE